MSADFFRLFKGCGLARTNRPDRLVGDDEFRDLLRLKARERSLDLIRNVGKIRPRFADLERFAAADDRRDACRIRRVRALVDALVRLAEVVTAFAVSEDTVGNADLFKHLG